MSWDSYIAKLTEPDKGNIVVPDAAIVGIEAGAESVWASTTKLKDITVAEIKALIATDRSKLCSAGVTLAGMRCTLLRDQLLTEHTMDIRTKGTTTEPTTYNITVAKSNKALVIAMGGENVHGGIPNTRAFKMAEHLRGSQL